MSQAENIAAQKKFGEAVNSGRLHEFQSLVDAGCVDHDPAPHQKAGPEGYVEFFSALRAAFPDLKVSVEHLVADDHNVSFAYTMTGTHKGAFLGIAATGHTVKVRGMQISRFNQGMMVERWGSSDELGILRQLGVELPS